MKQTWAWIVVALVTSATDVGAAPKLIVAAPKLEDDAATLPAIADQTQRELVRALAKNRPGKLEVYADPSAERLGSAFVAESVLGKYRAELGAAYLITGSAQTNGEEVSLSFALWSTDPPERVTTATAAVTAERVPQAAERLAGIFASALDRQKPPPPKVAVAPPPPPPVVSTSKVAPPPPVAPVVVETKNSLARWTIGIGATVLGLAVLTGVGSQVLFNQPLNDGEVRSRSDNDDLLANGETTALIADIGLLTGGVLAIFGVTSWITGLGEGPVEE